MGKKILIAEDDPVQLKVLARGFAIHGFDVYTAATCKEAVELLYRHFPDCFLLDYHLLDDTAQLICLSARSLAPTREAPIVILSGDETMGVASYESCQADSFVLKGRGYEESLAAINRHLRRTEARKKIQFCSDLTLDYENTAILVSGKQPVAVTAEQFRFFAAIFERKRLFVREREMLARVFSIAGKSGTSEALSTLAQRLKAKLGTRLAKRIRRDKYSGWIYLEPRRSKTAAADPLHVSGAPHPGSPSKR